MARTTIDFGIDLGTTNSSIAERSNGNLCVFKNHEERETIPSAVFINNRNELIVGRKAKERVESDPGNAFSEFKLAMGRERDYLFEYSGRRMKAEDLSAEVLKTLLATAQRRTGQRPDAAVITVPAAFELPHCAATTRAAELAGLQISPLLQEPVAAALAYGFQNERDGVYWLVYDFGGGTFDAAVIAVRDGMIEVVAHEGDNHLGGKNIDWKIVEDLLIPKVAGEFHVTDFRRGGHSKWRGAIAKLKGAAEDAKIQLSSAESADIHIDFLCQDDQGSPIEFDYTLTRRAMEQLAEPLISRSIDICRSSLAAKRLETRAIEKVLLVGGPTGMPYLRQRLEEELKIPLEFRFDPMTIVARGAAIFASTQRISTAPIRPTVQGEFVLQLEGNRMGPEPEPLLGGKVIGTSTIDFSTYTIEFINQTVPSWRSGKISLGPDGGFWVTLWAEKGRVNRFAIEVYDSVGTCCKTTPEHWEYEVGIGVPEQPLIHSVCIELRDKSSLRFIEKGTGLPAQKRNKLWTSGQFVRGQAAPLVRIPVYEGEHRRADRNTYIGELMISGDDSPRDLPPNTEVHVAIEVDKSRILQVKAFIPLLEKDFEAKLHLGVTQVHTKDRLEVLFKEEQKRLEQLREQTERAGDARAIECLKEVEAKFWPDTEQAFQRASFDLDAPHECENRLKTLRQKLDDLELILEWTVLTGEVEGELKNVHVFAQNHGTASNQQAIATLKQEIQQAVSRKDSDTLRRKLTEVGSLEWQMWMEHGPTLVELLQHLETRQPVMSDPGRAQRLITQGHQAINGNDIPMLRGAVRQLFQLLPKSEQERTPHLGGTLKIMP